MTPTYLIHLAERSRTPAEQRAADVRSSELAAASAALCRSFAGPFRSLRRTAQQVPVESDQRPERAGWPAAEYSL